MKKMIKHKVNFKIFPDGRGCLHIDGLDISHLVDSIQTAAGYRYIAAQVALKSITAVYIDGALVDSGDYSVAYSGDYSVVYKK